MSENTTETVETEAQDVQETETAPSIPQTGNAVVDGLIALAVEKATVANGFAETVASAKGNFAKSVKDYRDNSEDEDVAKYREWEEKVYDELNRRRGEIDKAIAERLGGTAITPEELDKAETSYKDSAKDAREAWKAAQSTAKMFGVTLEGDAPALKTLGGRDSSVAGHKGATGKRYRFDDVTVNGESVGSLSKAALLITSKSGVKTNAKDLQDAMVDSAKTDDVNKLNGFNFEYSNTKDGNTTRFDIVVFKAQEETEAPAA